MGRWGRNAGDLQATAQDSDFFVVVWMVLPPLLLPETQVFIFGKLSAQADSSQRTADLLSFCNMDPIYMDKPKKSYPDRCVYILLSAQVTMVSDLSGPRLREDAGSRLLTGGPLKASFRSMSTPISLCH